MEVYFKKLCSNFNLGKFISYEVIAGGLTNENYKVVTEDGIFVIKKICNKFSDEIINERENIAKIVSLNGINAVVALEYNNSYVQHFLNDRIMIFPYCDGEVLCHNEITLNHLINVVSQLKKMHSIKFKSNKLNKYEFIDFSKYYDLLINCNDEYADCFIKNYELIKKIYEKTVQSINNIPKVYAYTHNDLKRKNIIFKNYEPFIIDFETANINYKWIEFFSSAWFLTDDIVPLKFKCFFKEYISDSDYNLDFNSFICAGIIDEFCWLEFSLNRALGLNTSDSNEIELGKNSIKGSIKEIINYYEKIPLMLEIIEEVLNCEK